MDGTQRYVADVCYTVTVLIVGYIESSENISPLPLPLENMLHFPKDLAALVGRSESCLREEVTVLLS